MPLVCRKHGQKCQKKLNPRDVDGEFSDEEDPVSAQSVKGVDLNSLSANPLREHLAEMDFSSTGSSTEHIKRLQEACGREMKSELRKPILDSESGNSDPDVCGFFCCPRCHDNHECGDGPQEYP